MTYIILLLLLSFPQSPECHDCTTLKVTVSGFRNDKGEGFLALYANKEGYPMEADKAVKKTSAPIVNGQASFEIAAVKPGSYALIALHDENKNGKMDKNLLGMPKEGYGASNNPRMPTFSPPSFESAVFKTTPGVMTMTFPLHYYPH